MTQTLQRAVERLRALPPEEQDRIGRRLLDELDGGGEPETPAPPDRPGSLLDWIEPYTGVFDSREHVPGGARMSEDTGRTFAEGLEEKRRQGRL